jgi:hypothetical protein
MRLQQSMRDRYSEDSTNCSKLPLWGEVEAGGASNAFQLDGSNNTLNQVIRRAFTSDPMKSGKYGVQSGSRTFTFLAGFVISFRTVSRSVPFQLPRRDSRLKEKASVFDFRGLSVSVKTSPWSRPVQQSL